MGEETITIDGEQITLTTEEWLTCGRCDHEWTAFNDRVCPECGTSDYSKVITEHIDEWGKIIYNGTSSIEDMAATLERRAKILRKLRESGWERRGVVDTGHATLEKCE